MCFWAQGNAAAKDEQDELAEERSQSQQQQEPLTQGGSGLGTPLSTARN